MVLGVIITVGIAVVVVLVIIKLLRDPNIGKNTNKTKQCIACGNKTNSLICEFCKKKC
ncbi:Hypothetical protein Nlim_0573 [Candidatus Nitrosarchaeum limnium SFB1]|uniref:Uncharacterized protein n=1 Tax=Candidatus Nitrosarchaeum limnium SFB1 TaxID=886738 RepID=F3KJB4_9ARCH|nr:Hypothetical protein Nlim_0573 [Candidatus Nitrosarchaeum limnium SFB1]